MVHLLACIRTGKVAGVRLFLSGSVEESAIIASFDKKLPRVPLLLQCFFVQHDLRLQMGMNGMGKGLLADILAR